MSDAAQMIVLVTGATAGFGEATARRFVREGHKVIISGRRAERLSALADELGEAVHPARFSLARFPADTASTAHSEHFWQGGTL